MTTMQTGQILKIRFLLLFGVLLMLLGECSGGNDLSGCLSMNPSSGAYFFTDVAPVQTVLTLTCANLGGVCNNNNAFGSNGGCPNAAWQCSITDTAPTLTTTTQIDFNPNSFANSGSSTGNCQLVITGQISSQANYNMQFVDVQIIDQTDITSPLTYTVSLTINVTYVTTSTSTTTTTTSTTSSTSTSTTTTTSTSTSTSTTTKTSTSTTTTTFPTTTTSLPWIFTPAGIAVLVVSCAVGVALIGTALYCLITKCHPAVNQRHVRPQQSIKETYYVNQPYLTPTRL